MQYLISPLYSFPSPPFLRGPTSFLGCSHPIQPLHQAQRRTHRQVWKSPMIHKGHVPAVRKETPSFSGILRQVNHEMMEHPVAKLSPCREDCGRPRSTQRKAELRDTERDKSPCVYSFEHLGWVSSYMNELINSPFILRQVWIRFLSLATRSPHLRQMKIQIWESSHTHDHWNMMRVQGKRSKDEALRKLM